MTLPAELDQRVVQPGDVDSARAGQRVEARPVPFLRARRTPLRYSGAAGS